MPACTVYFDGACPVCRAEIAHYQRQRGAEAIAWVDASNCDEEALGPGVDRATVLSRFHVREADGSLASGAAAFGVIWRRLPAFAWLGTLASFRPVLAVLEAGYGLFLRIRPWWRPANTGALPAHGSPVARIGQEMNLYNRLPGFERAADGQEWALIRHLPLLATRAASARAARLAETDAIAVCSAGRE